ncbi:bifunctional OB-fold nucleic acid binding domain-containing protein/MaoC family dehydratase [Sphingomonas sp. KC8]|uniref:bifunctional OB-fold nucleic acid binding domain-containing protein/MaoC family dehydratase n=1 Tax=Sphingomonas sp. KC8 TaxID=1030157 RepID=UPI000248984B|nr:MaoC/PaaZ C-terminal domain-containing protein [Sphingomonas sp. KC8]ARS29418.1 hypothetical protein KC8_19285 [Sphingomonas sp. KC8]
MMTGKPLPVPTETSRPFWASLQAHRIDIQQCADCSHWIFFPRRHCPRCFSLDLNWRTISGEGTLLTYTTAHIPTLPEFADEMLQQLAVVRLDEGPHLNTTLVGLETGEIHVGMRVKPVFHDVAPGKTTLLRYTAHDKNIDLNTTAASPVVSATTTGKRQVDFRDLDAMRSLIHDEYSGWSEPFVVTQELIDQFAVLSGDDYWIHTDPDRARKEGPFGTTIAHGSLVQVLATRLRTAAEWEVTGFTNMVNYGSNKLRFPTPVPAGSPIHARSRVRAVGQVKAGTQLTLETCIHIVGNDRPSVINELIILYM